MNSAGALGAGLARVQAFAELFCAGVRTRLERDVAVETAEAASTSLDALAADVQHAVLLARVVWDESGDRHGGCLLWMGDLGLLLGDEKRDPSTLTDDEVATLDASLRLSIEEGADGEMPFEWSAVERVLAGDLAAALREGGVSEPHECARAVVRLGDAHQTFLLVPADGTAITTSAGETPAATGEAAGAPEKAAAARPDEAAVPAGYRNLEHLLDVRLPLTIRLGSTRMSLDDVLRLAPGSVVELDRSEDEPLEVLANGRVIARGEVVVVDERFGLRITEIGSAEERLRASI
ncbi:MAG: flagellar motor switch protein FliN [bacterium]